MKKRSRASGFILGDQVKSLVIWMDLKLKEELIKLVQVSDRDAWWTPNR